MYGELMETTSSAPDLAMTGAGDEPLGVLVVGAGHVVMALIKSAFETGPLRPRDVLLLSLLSREGSMAQRS